LAVAGLVASGVAQVVLAHRTARPGGILEHRYLLLAEIGLWWLVVVAAVVCVRALPRRAAVLLVLVLAVTVRIAALSDKAPLSDDLYRYAWDGAVQHAGINPYRYAPNAEALRPLREQDGMSWLWPAQHVGSHSESLINREGVPTIYPPVAQVWFAAVHAVVPLSARDRGYQAVGLGVDLAVLAALLALLRAGGRDPRHVAWYALAPLPVLEAVQNAHVDVLAVLLALGALALAGRRPAAAGGALALAALVKVYPALLLPLLMRRSGTRVRVVAVFAGTCALAYLPHVLAVGPRTAGYLTGYLVEERYDEGTRYLLLGLLGLRGTAATVVMVLTLLAAMLWLTRSAMPLPEAGVRLFAAVLLLVTPVQPWYGLLLLALVGLTGAWWAVPVAAAGYPLYFATILDGPATGVGQLAYGLAAAVVLTAAGSAALRRRAGRRPPGRTSTAAAAASSAAP
jgi:hypothetical protein